MSKTAMIIAIFFPGTAFAAMPVLATSTQTQQPEQSQNESVIGTHGASDQLSMGPDPGGKTGDTVTPTTTKTGQAGADGTDVSRQSGASSTAAPGVASDKTDPKAGPTSGSEASKR